MEGVIARWDDEKGYGFITPREGGRQVFVHIKAFQNRTPRPTAGQAVTYQMSSDRQGRPCADQARLVSESVRRSDVSPSTSSSRPAGTRSGATRASFKKRSKTSLPVIAAWLFLLLVGLLVLTAQLPRLVLWFYLASSLVTYLIYAIDKSAARRGDWRTQESTLHLLSMIGGWPGALIAQEKLRHKTRKQSFRIVFGLTVLFNGVMLVTALLVWAQ